ncbi:transcription factor HES-5-like [Bufo gargarizans]|uniref:transcription factor HES-5-like n=1 Tax=Bufo gargarizans TaxID=30331 RepID=UPI001CF3D253|nr:transcription factor HES-5-like [Bufo gargarizans]
MAPITVFMEQHKVSPKEKNKMRKPIVEKMRRDRINTSIEQLKLLLEKEFHKQQPNVKLEKADILEMAVTYLKQQTLPLTNNIVHQNNGLQVEFSDGYNQCFNEVLSFLSLHQNQMTTELRLLNHFKLNEDATMSSSSSSSPARYCHVKQSDLSNHSNTLWRPW